MFSLKAASEENKGFNSSYIEGKSFTTEYKGKIKRIIEDILDSVRSSMSYVGARTLVEFRNNAEFIQVSSASVQEGQTHFIE